jgi:hypothetical protein
MKKRILISRLLVVMATACLISPVERLQASEISRPANRIQVEEVTCITASNDRGDARRFTARRNKKNVQINFFPIDLDKQVGIVKYEVTVLHDQAKAKKGDRLLPWGPCGTNSTSVFRSNAYKKQSQWSCGSVTSSKIEPCTSWIVDKQIESVRDEANGVALVGYNASGKVQLRLYRAFSEKLDGSFTGKLNKWACKSGRVGEPLSRSVFVGSKAFLSVVGLATYNKGTGEMANMAGFILDRVALAANVDPNTGLAMTQPKATLIVKVDLKKSRSKKQEFTEEEKLYLKRAWDTATDALKKKVTDSIKSPVIKQISGKSIEVAADVYFVAEDARAFITSLDEWSATAKTWSGLCNVWDGTQ